MPRISARCSGGVVLLAVAVALLWSPQFAPASEAADPPGSRELCTRLWTGYVETLKAADPVKIAGWFTKDAVLIYPDMAELHGRDAIQAAIAPDFQGLKFLEQTFQLAHCAVVGEQAFTFVTLDEVHQQGTGPQVKSQARCGVVWQRQPDSSWQILHFLVNYAKP